MVTTKYLNEINIEGVWFSQSGESINIKRKLDGNIYTIKKTDFMNTQLGKIIKDPNSAIFLKNVPVKFNDKVIIKWYENRYIKINDFVCNLKKAKEIIESNVTAFHQESELTYQKIIKGHEQKILQQAVFSKFINSLAINDIMGTLQRAANDNLFINSYNDFLHSETDEEDYNDHNNEEEFILEKNRLIDDYKNKYFLTWPTTRVWIHNFLSNHWRYTFFKSPKIEFLEFKNNNQLSIELDQDDHIYVFCKKTKFTNEEKDFLLKTFYKHQKNKRVLSFDSLVEDSPILLNSTLW